MIAYRTTSRRKPAAKQEAVLAQVRQEILSGRWPPGQRLPTRLELQRRFQVSCLTVQGALDRLRADGFVEPRGARGTFVPERLPHLANYGLVFPLVQSDDRATWSKFWLVLERVAQGLAAADAKRRICLLYGADGRVDAPGYQHLLATVQARRVAGLIYVTNPLPVLHGRTHEAAPELPEVCIGREPVAGMSRVVLDYADLQAKALAWFIARGRRRVGSFYLPRTAGSTAEAVEFCAALTAHGLQSEPFWHQPAGTPAFGLARHAAELLGRLPPERRPDALLVRDDNLEEHVVAGLLAAGVRIGQEMDLVCHANLPSPTPMVAPVTRIGFDCRRVLEAAMGLIDRRRSGLTRPASARVPAVLADVSHHEKERKP